jgi:colanic acid biosynthesis glycosyl transferase WcaI
MNPPPLPTFRDIVILTQYYAPEPGAPQIRLRALARELSRLGISVRVLTAMPNYPLGRILKEYQGKLHVREQIDGLPVDRVWLYPAAGRGSVKRLANYLSFTFLVLPYLLFARRPDLVFVEAQPLSLAFPVWLLKAVRGVPYVYNTPDLQVEIAAEANWIGARWLIRAAAAIEGFFMRRALSVSTVSHAFMEHFAAHRRVPASRLSFLPNGADTDALRPLPFDSEYAAKLGIGRAKVFTYAGTHADYHGLDVILEAAKLLRDRPDIVILMVGQGPSRQRLRDDAAGAGLKNVLFRDSPFEEMARLMSITYASLVVLRDLPSSRKMRLAKTIPPLACGVPLIYAGHGESAQIVQKESCGLVIEPEHPEKLAAAIRWLTDHPDERTSMGRRGRLLAERGFSWKAIVQDWFRQIGCIEQGNDPGVLKAALGSSAPREMQGTPAVVAAEPRI